jgi:hypothetical protein
MSAGCEDAAPRTGLPPSWIVVIVGGFALVSLATRAQQGWAARATRPR